MGIFNRQKIETRHIRVCLKPIKGVSPRIYVPVLYITILIFIIAAVTIAISSNSPKRYIHITSTPSRAAVYNNGLLIGSTPIKVRRKRKDSSIKIVKKYFQSKEIVINRDSNLNEHFKLKAISGEKLLEESYRELSDWSLIKDTNVTYRKRVPNILSNSVIDYLSIENRNRELLDSYLLKSSKNVTNSYIFSDYIRALTVIKSDKRLPSISTIKNSALFINRAIDKMPNAPILFYNKILIDDSFKTELSKELNSRHKRSLNKGAISFAREKRSKWISDFEFNYIPQSTIKPFDVNFIHNIKQDAFYISSRMVSKKSYNLFIKENPKWSRDNIDQLTKEMLVDNYYLETTDNNYITNISYYAAKAWIKWANSYYNLPKGYKMALPTENMWHAALLKESVYQIDAWQWTTEGFYIYDHFLADSRGDFLEEFTTTSSKLVVGKNRYNDKLESGRGVQRANWCSPFLSFRPVLIKE